MRWLRQHFWGQSTEPRVGVGELSARLFIDRRPREEDAWSEDLLLNVTGCEEAEQILVLLADMGTTGRVHLVYPREIPHAARKRLLSVARSQRHKEMWVYW